MFDVGYLLTEVLTDNYLAFYGIRSIEALPAEEQEILVEVSANLQSWIPIPKRTELQSMLDQTKIEFYYQRLIKQHITWPPYRFMT